MAEQNDAAVLAMARAWLEAQGVDVDRSLAAARREQAGDARRAREAADGLRGLAIELKKAHRVLRFEEDGLAAGTPGFTPSRCRDAAERVTWLDDALYEAAGNDRSLARAVSASVA